MLRDELIEAGAEALWKVEDREELPFESYFAKVHVVLDAILDTLEANADEWVEQAGWLPADIATGNVRRDLIAALRPPVSSSQENPDEGGD